MAARGYFPSYRKSIFPQLSIPKKLPLSAVNPDTFSRNMCQKCAVSPGNPAFPPPNTPGGEVPSILNAPKNPRKRTARQTRTENAPKTHTKTHRNARQKHKIAPKTHKKKQARQRPNEITKQATIENYAQGNPVNAKMETQKMRTVEKWFSLTPQPL